MQPMNTAPVGARALQAPTGQSGAQPGKIQVTTASPLSGPAPAPRNDGLVPEPPDLAARSITANPVAQPVRLPSPQTACLLRPDHVFNSLCKDPSAWAPLLVGKENQIRKNLAAEGRAYDCQPLTATLINMQRLAHDILTGRHLPKELAQDERWALALLHNDGILELLGCDHTPYEATVKLAVVLGTVLEVIAARHLASTFPETQPGLQGQNRLETFEFHDSCALEPAGSRVDAAQIKLAEVLSCRWAGFNCDGDMDENERLFAGKPGLWNLVSRRLGDSDIFFYPTFEAVDADTCQTLMRASVYPLCLTTDYATLSSDGVLRTPLAFMQHTIDLARQSQDLPPDGQDRN